MSNAAIIAGLPSEVRRVKVRTPDGRSRFKAPAEVTEDDVIEVRQDGQPIVTMNQAGRPSSSAQVPSEEQALLLAERQQLVDDHLRRDPVVRGIRRDPDGGEVFVEVLAAMSREVSLLEHQRNELVGKQGIFGADATTLTIKRIQGLKLLFEAMSRRREQQQVADLDPTSPGVREIIAAVVEAIREAMLQGGIRQESVQTTFTRAAGIMGSTAWENELRVRVRTAMASQRGN